MMPDHLDRVCSVSRAMAVVKIKTVRLPRFAQAEFADQLPIVITGQDDELAAFRQLLEQPPRFPRRHTIVHQVAQNNEVCRLIIGQQFLQPIRD